VLRGTRAIPGGAGEDIEAITDARGRATFNGPAGTRAGTYHLTVTSPDGVPLRGSGALVLETTPAAPSTATLDPPTLSVSATTQGTRDVRVAVADAYGNPIAGRPVQLRPPQREGLSPISGETDAKGSATFTVPVGPLRDGDSLAVIVGDREVATLRATSAPAVAAANVAGGRAAGLMLEAARLAATGNHARAETVYDSVLAIDPNIIAARLGRAYVRSWQRKDSLARQDFQTVLRADSANVSALTGLGYNYAWGGAWDDAEARFHQALRIAPSSIDAARGLAYVALWRGDAREAVHRFQSVAELHPHDAETQVGLGQAEIAAENPARARTAFQRALSLDPGRADARNGLAATRTVTRPPFELSLWGGYTSFSDASDIPTTGGGTSGIGVRFAEVAYWPTPTTRVWVQYENGLSLDNVTFVRAGKTAPSFYLGGFTNYGDGRYTSRLEAGYRRLPGDIDQGMVRAEQVINLQPSGTVKLGGWIGPRSDHHTEWLGYGAFGWQLTPHLRVEPTIFYSRSGVPGESERRLLLYGEYAFPSGVKLGTGIAGGIATPASVPSLLPVDPLAATQENQKLWDAFLIAEAPFGVHRAHLLLRHQQILHSTGLTVVALGFTLGLGY
jgi:Tfp pilus assembly protein PilF